MKSEILLTNPPIIEAIIDIQVSFNEEISLECFDLADAISENFPTKKLITRLSGEIRFNSTGVEAQELKRETIPYGYRYSSIDNLYVVQSTRKGLTVSRLKPYSIWDELLSTAQAMWEIYTAKAKPVSTSRIAVRYINSLDLPFPIKDYGKWLNVPIVIPKHSGFGVEGFFHRTYGSDGTNNLIFTLAQEARKHEKKLPIILDIDIFKEEIYSVNDQGIWDSINKFREIKNSVFYESITENTMELYK